MDVVSTAELLREGGPHSPEDKRISSRPPEFPLHLSTNLTFYAQGLTPGVSAKVERGDSAGTEPHGPWPREAGGSLRGCFIDTGTQNRSLWSQETTRKQTGQGSGD